MTASAVDAPGAHAGSAELVGDGRVTTIVGGPVDFDPFNGSLRGSAVLGRGVFVASGTTIVRADIATGDLTVVAGAVAASGCVVNQSGASARFTQPRVIGSDTRFIYVLDKTCGDVLRVDPTNGATSVFVTDLISPVAYVVTPSYLFVLDLGTVYRWTLASGARLSLQLGPLSSYSALVGNDQYIWCVSPKGFRQASATTGEFIKGWSSETFPGPTGSSAILLNNSIFYPLAGSLYRLSLDDNTVARVAGVGTYGHVDGVGAQAWLGQITGISSDGTSLYLSEVSSDYGSYVRRVSPPSLDINAPTFPTAFTVLSVTSTSVRLGWSASSDDIGVTGYDVYAGGTRVTGTSSSTTVTVTDLKPGTSYTFSVKAHDAAGNTSPFSLPVTATTTGGKDTTAPSVPTGLQVLANAGTSVRLGWNASTDNVAVTGYDVYLGAERVTGTSTSTTTTVAGLKPGTSYTFSVKAHDAAGNASAASNSVTVVTAAAVDTVAPTVPTGVKVLSVTANSIRIGWTASTDNVGVAGYDVFANGDRVTGTSGSVTVSIGELRSKATYAITVRARDAAGNVSAFSTPLTVTTLSPTA